MEMLSSIDQEDKIKHHFSSYTGTESSHLIILHDKYVYWNRDDMPMYDNGERISVDLMRFKPGAPSGTMDFIFLSLFEWAKEEGYRVFNIGM